MILAVRKQSEIPEKIPERKNPMTRYL